MNAMKWIEVTTFPNKKQSLICLGTGCRIERSNNPLNKNGAVILSPGDRAIDVEDKYEHLRQVIMAE